MTSDLALPAAKEALKRAGRKPEDVDLIVLGTTSPDYITPDTAVVLQYKLGAKNAGTFDVGCACAAFPPMIAIGSGLIATNAAIKTILVIAVDMIHRLTDPNDPGCFLWSDGAGAVVLEGGSLQGFIGAAFQADGSAAPWLAFTFLKASQTSRLGMSNGFTSSTGSSCCQLASVGRWSRLNNAAPSV